MKIVGGRLIAHIALVAMAVAACGRPPSSTTHVWASASLSDPCSVQVPPATGFSRPLRLTNQASTSGAPISLALADVDGDGALDIVVSRGGVDGAEHGVVEVLFAPFAKSDPCASTTNDVTAARTWTSADSNPNAKITVGDIAGDTCTDLVVGRFDGGLDLFVASRQSGSCTLPAHAQHVIVAGAASVGVSDVKLADLDGDGKLDIVAARFDRSAPTSPPLAQAILWNRNGSFGSASWLSDETLIGALAVLIRDFDGDGVPDVLFGSRASGSSAALAFTWGALHHGVHGAAPSTSPQLFTWPSAPTRLSDVPYLLDLDAFPSGAASVISTSSAHLCETDACARAATLQAYQWTSGALAPIALLPQLSGDWLLGATATLDADPATDGVFPLACGSKIQKPGRLMIYRSGTSAYAPRALAVPDEIVRALEIGDVDPTTAGSEIVIGGARSNADGTTTNSGHVAIVYTCTSP